MWGFANALLYHAYRDQYRRFRVAFVVSVVLAIVFFVGLAISDPHPSAWVSLPASAAFGWSLHSTWADMRSARDKMILTRPIANDLRIEDEE